MSIDSLFSEVFQPSRPLLLFEDKLNKVKVNFWEKNKSFLVVFC